MGNNGDNMDIIKAQVNVPRETWTKFVRACQDNNIPKEEVIVILITEYIEGRFKVS